MAVIGATLFGPFGSFYAYGQDPLAQYNYIRSQSGLPPLMDAQPGDPAMFSKACRYDLGLLTRECQQGNSLSCNAKQRIESGCNSQAQSQNPVEQLNHIRSQSGLPPLVDAQASDPEAARKACKYDLGLLNGECQQGNDLSCQTSQRLQVNCDAQEQSTNAMEQLNNIRSQAGLPPLLDAQPSDPARFSKACKYDLGLVTKECQQGNNLSSRVAQSIQPGCSGGSENGMGIQIAHDPDCNGGYKWSREAHLEYNYLHKEMEWSHNLRLVPCR
jgi:hypothetical protein